MPDEYRFWYRYGRILAIMSGYYGSNCASGFKPYLVPCAFEHILYIYFLVYSFAQLLQDSCDSLRRSKTAVIWQPWYDSRDRTWQTSGQVRSDPNILVLGLLVLYSRVVLSGPQASGTHQHGCPQVELVKELGDEDVNLQDSRHVLFLHIPGKRNL